MPWVLGQLKGIRRASAVEVMFLDTRACMHALLILLSRHSPAKTSSQNICVTDAAFAVSATTPKTLGQALLEASHATHSRASTGRPPDPGGPAWDSCPAEQIIQDRSAGSKTGTGQRGARSRYKHAVRRGGQGSPGCPCSARCGRAGSSELSLERSFGKHKWPTCGIAEARGPIHGDDWTLTMTGHMAACPWLRQACTRSMHGCLPLKAKAQPLNKH